MAVAATAAIFQKTVIDTFMRKDAVRPSEAIHFEPDGNSQRRIFEGLTKADIIKAEGARWHLDVAAYKAAHRKQWYKILAVIGLVIAAAAVATLR